MLFPVVSLLVMIALAVGAVTALVDRRKSPRAKALWLYWAGLVIELLWWASGSNHEFARIVLAVTVVAGAVTIFALPGSRPGD